MSLNDCIKKSKISAKDASAIRKLVNEGVPEQEALAQFKSTLSQNLEDIAARVEKQGGKVARTEPKVFKQDDKETPKEPKGSIEILDEGAIIRLNKTSDLSTFLHETGHLFLELETRFAEKYGVTEDQAALLDYLGVKKFSDIKTKHHEKFAETFEQYLMEGKAPSTKLGKAFRTFRAWLSELYRGLFKSGKKLPKDITEVFDRMLATESEIAAASADPMYDQFFKSKEHAGMTEDEIEAFNKRVEATKKKAQETVDSILMKELKYRKSKEWKEQKKPLIAQEKARLERTPVYQVIKELQTTKLDWDTTLEILKMDKPKGRLIGKVTKTDGVDPELVAEGYGFTSAKTMLNQVLEAPKLSKAADAAAEQRMIEMYGDILNDGSIERVVRDAMHNEEHAKMLIEELKLAKKAAKRPPDVNVEKMKQNAANHISHLKYKEIRPHRFYRAEIRSAKKAATAKDAKEKLLFKTQQASNYYLYKEAQRVREKMTKQRKNINKSRDRKYDNKKYAPEYVRLIYTYTRMYDLKGKKARRESANEIINWFLTHQNAPDEFQDLGMNLFDLRLLEAIELRKQGKDVELNLPKFDDLSAEELQGVNDTLEHFKHLARENSEVEREKLRAEVDSFVESIKAKGGKDKEVTRGIEHPGDKIKDHAVSLFYNLPGLNNLVNKLDGFDENGLARKMIFSVVEEANNTKLAKAHEYGGRLEKELAGLKDVQLSRWDKEDIKLADGSVLKGIHTEARFMMGIYWGTESSREAIRQGFGVTDADVLNILSKLTPEQLEMMNAVWKFNESIWPELKEAGMIRDGVVPPKLDATSFEVNGVKLTGGHQRLIYDSTKIGLKAEQQEGFNQNNVMPVKAASLHSRVGSGGAPPALDTNNIIRALDDNIHFIAYAEAGKRIRRLVNDPRIVEMIEKKHGQVFYKTLIKNLKSITTAENERESIKSLAALLRLVRRAFTFKHLSYSIRNTLQQPSAAYIAFREVGARDWVMSAVDLLGKDPETTRKQIDELSPFMRERASLINREASEVLKTVLATNKAEHAWHMFTRHGFTPQTLVDRTIAYPTWVARFNQSMAKHDDVKRAVSDADLAVSKTVGSGSDLHLGTGFQTTNTETARIFTMFGSWFNNYFQRVYEDTRGFESIQSTLGNRKAIESIFMTPMIVGAISAALVMDLPQGDEFWSEGPREGWLEWLLKRYASFNVAMFPILRDIFSAFSGFTPTTAFSTALGSVAAVGKEAEAYAEGRQTGLKTASDIFKATTYIAPVPGSGQATRIVDYVDSFGKGREGMNFNIYQAAAEGPQRNP